MSRTPIVLAFLFSCLLAAAPASNAEDIVTEPILTFTGHTTSVNSVAFSPDGTKVLTGGDTTARLWNGATGALIRTFTGHTSVVQSVAFSPDGTKVLTGSWDKTARLWDAATGECIATFVHTSFVNSVAFSPDGTKVLTASDDYTPRLWNITGGHICTFTGHTGIVQTAVFSPDGTKVLTGSADNTARLWDAATGAHIRTFAGHTARVWCVAFSPDGAMVLTGSNDNTAKLWYAEPPTLSVRSSPFSGLHVSPHHAELTPYERVCYAPATVGFSAQPLVFNGFVAYSFAFWKINGVPQPPRQTDIEVHVEADTAVEAVYELFGDVDVDCRVGILDLIFIRNRLNAGVGTDGNWRADVNQDGKINILDLIHVRNRLNAACP